MGIPGREHLAALAGSPLTRLSPVGPPRPVSDWRLGRWRWLQPATVVAATGAWLMGSLAPQEAGLWHLPLVAAGAVLTGAAAGLPLWQHHRADVARSAAIQSAVQARTAMRVALEDALDPVVHVLGRLTALRGIDKAHARGEAIQLVLNTIAALADAHRVRVCFYLLDAGPPQELRLDAYAGRAGAPQQPLLEGTRAGNAALRQIADRTWVHVLDADRGPVPPWWKREYGSRTLLAGPVVTGDRAFGLLTLDSAQPGDLARVDPVLVRLLADLLATALAL